MIACIRLTTLTLMRRHVMKLNGEMPFILVVRQYVIQNKQIHILARPL